MVSKTTLNAKNLEALGAAHLAQLLIDISEGNANARRRLRLELAGAESPGKLGNEIRKRLTAIGAATTNVGWRTLKGFRADLNTQRRLIAEQVATTAPADAAELMWQFLSLGDAVIARTSDVSGGVVEIFREACTDMGRILTLETPNQKTPDQNSIDLNAITAAVLANSYGQNDGLIPAIAQALDTEALKRLRDLVVTAEPPAAPLTRPRTAKTWRKRALAASEALRKRTKAESVRTALLAIADALGDVDAFIALQPDRHTPAVATGIAQRLLAAQRPDKALQVLNEARQTIRGPEADEAFEARLSALEALDCKVEAQAARLERFHQTLEATVLRAHLKRLADFDDVEAEDAALDFAKDFPDANVALAFLIRWPAPMQAADLVVQRATELDGLDATALTFAADRMTSRYPLASLLLHRQIVEAGLRLGTDKMLDTAVLSYLEAESLARHIDDFGRYDTHEAWRLRLTHDFTRRRAFWSALPA